MWEPPYKSAKVLDVYKRPPRSNLLESQILGEHLPQIWANSRALFRSNFICKSISRAYLNHICESGLNITGAHSDFMFHEFTQWAESCHTNGTDGLNEIMRELIEVTLIYGDALLISPISKKYPGNVASKLEIINGARIRTPDEFKKGERSPHGKVVNGVVYDSENFIVGWYVLKRENESEKLSDFHYFPRKLKSGKFNAFHFISPVSRAGNRGLPIINSVVESIHDTGLLWDSAQQQEFVRSKLEVYLTSSGQPELLETFNAVDENGDAVDGGNYYRGGIDGADLPHLPIGAELKSISHSGASNIVELMHESLRNIASALGIPYHILMSDYSQTNYSSSKMGAEDWYKQINIWIQALTKLMREVYASFHLEYCTLHGLTYNPVDGTFKSIVGASKITADDLKQAQGFEKLIELGLITKGQVSALRGVDYGDLLEEIKAEQELEEKILGNRINNKKKTEVA